MISGCFWAIWTIWDILGKNHQNRASFGPPLYFFWGHIAKIAPEESKDTSMKFLKMYIFAKYVHTKGTGKKIDFETEKTFLKIPA